MTTAAAGGENFSWDGFGQVQELTQRNQELLLTLDLREREIAQLTALAECGGNPLTADVRESKIVEIAKKNRTLTLALEREKAEKARMRTELKAAQAGTKDDGEPRTESQVEVACREVVAEAAEAAEMAQKEAAEWREKAKEAVARAERDSGRFATVKAESDRMRAIIKREVGEAAADFSRLEDSLAGAGGWRGRAQEISLLKDKVKELKLKLAAAVSAPAVEESRAPDGAPAKHETKHRENLAAESIKRRQGLENAEAQLVDAKEEAEALKRKANSAVARKAVVEKDLRGLREKLQVLTEKSAGDDKLIDALKSEIKKLFGSSGGGGGSGGSMRGGGLPGTGTSGSSGPGGMDGGGQHNFAGVAVPAAVYQAVERRAQAQQQQIQQQERVVQQMQQQMMQLRAKISSTEYELSASGGTGAAADFSAAGIAAAAAGLGIEEGRGGDRGDGGDGGLSDQNDDDVEALMVHAEGLERLTELLRGKLADSAKQVDELRDKLAIEHQQYVQLRARLESGDATAGGGGAGGGGGDEEVRVLRAALLAQREELERARISCRAQLEGMEQEVALYREMVQEMRAAKS